MLLNKEKIDWAREIIAKKKRYWEERLNVEFNEDGRAVIGTTTSFDDDDIYRAIRLNQSQEFKNSFEKALVQLKLKPFSIESISDEDYKTKRIQVETTKNRIQKKSLASLLQKAQTVWETEECEIYRDFTNHIKELRKSGETVDWELLSNIKKDMEVGNTYVAYDTLLREFQEQKVWISINPLDKIFSSGDDTRNEHMLTKFRSCWSNEIEKECDDVYNIIPDSCYANPEAQAQLGSHVATGMIFLTNGRSLTVDGMTFFGYLERSHIWLDSQEGIYVENMYPNKYNTKRIDEINGILKANGGKIASVDTWKPLNVDCDWFNVSEWYDELENHISRGKDIFLDRAAINNNGEVWLTEKFRYRTFGGTYRMPRNY